MFDQVRNKIRCVIFDSDLTLIDSFESVHKIYCLTAEAFGLKKPSKRVVKLHWGKKIPEMCMIFFGSEFGDRAYQILQEKRKSYEFKLYDGVVEVLRNVVNSGLSLGLLSTSDKPAFEPHLKRAGVWNLFYLTIGGDEIEQRKPDPRVFYRFLKRFKSEELVYVGDSLVDWEAARDAGLGLFLAVTTGFTSKNDFIAAGVPEIQILDSVANVPKALNIVD